MQIKIGDVFYDKKQKKIVTVVGKGIDNWWGLQYQGEEEVFASYDSLIEQNCVLVGRDESVEEKVSVESIMGKDIRVGDVYSSIGFDDNDFDFVLLRRGKEYGWWVARNFGGEFPIHKDTINKFCELVERVGIEEKDEDSMLKLLDKIDSCLCPRKVLLTKEDVGKVVLVNHEGDRELLYSFYGDDEINGVEGTDHIAYYYRIDR